MAKKTINLGTGELTGDGESIRSAFDKINDNFDELYTQDAIDFDGDYNSLTNKPTIPNLASVDQNIVPDTDVAYDLGSAAKRFRDLYLSGSTIDLGGTTLSVVGGTLQIGGVDINDVVTGAGVDYSEIQNTPTIPSALSDLTNDLSDLDNLVAGEGIPDLLTAYTEASLAVDSLLNAGDYGGDLVAPSDYTFYDLVVARRAVNPLIPQELEQAALLQLNVYNAWQAEIAADKATITVGDYTWDFKGDGDLTIAGNIEVDGSFINNSVSDGSGLQVETDSDFEIKVGTAIWSFEPNDGGRIEFPDGSTQTTAYTGPQTTFDSDVDFNDIVKFAKTTTTGDDDNPTLTLIDVNSSSVQVLTSNSTSTNNWELPDGSEGQIMHFVAGGAGGSGANHKIKINNWWKRDADTGGWSSMTGYWDVFAIYGFAGRADTGMATAIFVDGAWRTTSPWVD